MASRNQREGHYLGRYNGLHTRGPYRLKMQLGGVGTQAAIDEQRRRTYAVLGRLRATLSKAEPLIGALRALGHRVRIDAEGSQSAWLDVGPLCVQVRSERGYGLYLEANQAFGSGPDEIFTFGQVDTLLERMRGLLSTGDAATKAAR